MVTLYALSQMAQKVTASWNKLSATFSYVKNGQTELKVTSENAMELQLVEVSQNAILYYCYYTDIVSTTHVRA